MFGQLSKVQIIVIATTALAAHIVGLRVGAKSQYKWSHENFVAMKKSGSRLIHSIAVIELAARRDPTIHQVVSEEIDKLKTDLAFIELTTDL